MIDYQALITQWSDGDLAPWAALLPTQIAAGLSQERYGDLARWLKPSQSSPAAFDRLTIDVGKI